MTPQSELRAELESGPGLGQWAFGLKVLVGSGIIAIAIKTLGPLLPLPATSAFSLALVLTPSLVLGVVLSWRLWIAAPANHAHPRRD